MPVFNYTGTPGTFNWSFTRGDEVNMVLPVADLAEGSYTITRVLGVETVTVNDPFNLTGKTFTAGISRTKGSAVLVSPTVTHNGTGGEITMSISQADSEGLTSGTYAWELVETTSGDTLPILVGVVKVVEGVVAR